MSEFLRIMIKTMELCLIVFLCIFIGISSMYVYSLYNGNARLPVEPGFLYVLADTYATTYESSSVPYLVRPEVVSILASEITSGCEDDSCRIHMVHKFMNKNFKYEKDEVRYRSREVWNPPEITLGRGVIGDCDDSAILIESLLKNFLNESYLIKTDNHLFNVVCNNEELIVLDQVSIFYGDDALNFISNNKPVVFYHYNDIFWQDNFSQIPCWNISEETFK